MSGPGKPPASKLPPQLSESTVQRLLSVQEQKIALDLKQADIALREIEHNQKIADKSIQAQAEDRRDDRAVEKAMHAHRLVFTSVMALLLVGFVLAAMWMGKDAMVLDVIKIMVGFVGGWGGSLAWQANSRRRNQEVE